MYIKTIAAVLALAASVPSAAAATTVCNATWTDAARSRAVPVRVRMPESAAPAPMVLFSHGLGGTLAAGTDWAEAWATH